MKHIGHPRASPQGVECMRETLDSPCGPFVIFCDVLCINQLAFSHVSISMRFLMCQSACMQGLVFLPAWGGVGEGVTFYLFFSSHSEVKIKEVEIRGWLLYTFILSCTVLLKVYQ